ncbi:O-antigen ligase family protein [Phytohabitans suffuscus]|uniref:O-antigen ligase-related domain-containing protein n=1 Tax=Phytohabitans suffuscus TaxID=624315 RepID=A0A6F8YDH3_9ACTN|nr:O-antigen ligase family protein [Phytohabitans suffuscus]BCB84184.1 hypothetical protein Psuf_014970 [Phytohabitans suffuscus]
MPEPLRKASSALTRRAPALGAAAVFVLAVPQIYLLPEGRIDIALTTILTGLLAPVLLLTVWRGAGRSLLRTWLVRALLGLLAVRMLALLWSPEPRSGLQPIVVLSQFVIMVALMAWVLRHEPGLVRRLHWLYWPWVAAEAALVVLFRVAPGVEDGFLRSVGGYFAGHNTAGALFGDGRNNVLDVAKSGGVFVNANVAAMFLGVNGLAALALAVLTRERWLRVLGVALLLTVPLTGSKSATVLMVALPAAAFGIQRMSRAATPAMRRYLLTGSLAGGTAVIALLLAVSGGLREAMVDAFVGRTVIWRFGAEEFREHPILGLGFGGWDQGFEPYAAQEGLYRSFPPHNVLLAAWANTGIAGLLLSAAFFALAAWSCLHRLTRGDGDQRLVPYAAAAVAWVFVQGMGENTDIFGDIHLIPILSLLIAYLIRPAGEESKDSATHHRGDSATPAVPAVGDVHREPGGGAAELPAAVRGPGPGADHEESRVG